MSESPSNHIILLPRVSVIVVIYGDEPWLRDCVEAINVSKGVDLEIVLVENGGSESLICDLESLRNVSVIRPGRNTGFAEGCNLGVAASTSPFIALVNPDALVTESTIASLVEPLNCSRVSVTTGSIRLADEPNRMNSAGNEIHFTGLSWAGAFGDDADLHTEPRSVAAASGAGMATTREHWDDLGGFCNEFFAYFEDTEFSIQTWLAGRQVLFVPDAVVVHRYEFSRNRKKYFWLERNRLITTLTCFSGRHLVALAPIAPAMELMILVIAAREGWIREKIEGYRWLVKNRRWLIARRRTIQGQIALGSNTTFLEHLSTEITAGNLEGTAVPRIVNLLAARYWQLIRRLL